MRSWWKNHSIATRTFSSSALQAIRPGRRQVRGHVLRAHESREVLGVARSISGRSASEPQRFSRELADRRQHPESRFGAGRVDADQAVTRQCSSRPACRLGVRHCDRGRIEAPPVGEHRQHRQQSRSAVVEQTDAPLDGRAERPLAFREVDRARSARRARSRAGPRRAVGREEPVRAAASSIASGTPSRRRQISRTAALFSAVSAKRGAPRRAIDEQADRRQRQAVERQVVGRGPAGQRRAGLCSARSAATGWSRGS